MSGRTGVLRNIQGLRALAVMAVALGHLQPLAERVHPLLHWVGIGRAGVDLFFVISGFIMVYTTEREQPSAARFALRRLIRIVPLYWLVTLGVFALALAAPGLLGASRAEPEWLVKSMLFIPFDKGDGTANPLVPVGWSLNYEMFFYAVFAAALLIPHRTGRYLASAAAIGALGLIGFTRGFDGLLANFYTRPIVVEFPLGILLGLVVGHLPTLRGASRQALAMAALAGLGVGLFASGFAAANEPARVAVAGVCAVGVMALALMLEQSGRAVTSPLVLAIGDASYAIYLTHLFVTQAFVIAAMRLGLIAPAPAAVLVVAALAACVIVGVLTWRLFERPAGRVLRRRFDAARPTSAATGSP